MWAQRRRFLPKLHAVLAQRLACKLLQPSNVRFLDAPAFLSRILSVHFLKTQQRMYLKPVGNIGIERSYMVQSVVQYPHGLRWLEAGLGMVSKRPTTEQWDGYQHSRVLLTLQFHG